MSKRNWKLSEDEIDFDYGDSEDREDYRKKKNRSKDIRKKKKQKEFNNDDFSHMEIGGK